ncbi:SMC-Scp complex subunit ScpB [Aestuariimicrobium sp. T2.26MG-19.2B]|uniref:SMC-Scp complex subunit ScpB n=1 Tax=Aestuariimicrobium sp. T2.26MG-19.2B TaxID=3040679 RepID=UPI0024775AFE|nr:SMC-Scp complex subunit ScpB [Aestuariimicrobium sp. T2.26MG-19.2B]CAI9408159.1 Segregation and condensation protein B [Aestuariimicrobium sp. T2.26MG-19.2B]
MTTPLSGAIEALLLMATESMTAIELAEATQSPVDEVEQALAEIVRFYDDHQRGIEVRHLAGGWRFWTRADHADLISAWVLEGQHSRLSQAALETLAVIAYLQPIARSRVSAVRGVNVDGVVRTLLARGLVAENEPADGSRGAGLLTTTDHFAERMGLESLGDLPPLAPHLPDASALEEELARVVHPEDTGTDRASSHQETGPEGDQR